jgi:hypothetical protein
MGIGVGADREARRVARMFVADPFFDPEHPSKVDLQGEQRSIS